MTYIFLYVFVFEHSVYQFVFTTGMLISLYCFFYISFFLFRITKGPSYFKLLSTCRYKTKQKSFIHHVNQRNATAH